MGQTLTSYFCHRCVVFRYGTLPNIQSRCWSLHTWRWEVAFQSWSTLRRKWTALPAPLPLLRPPLLLNPGTRFFTLVFASMRLSAAPNNSIERLALFRYRFRFAIFTTFRRASSGICSPVHTHTHIQRLLFTCGRKSVALNSGMLHHTSLNANKERTIYSLVGEKLDSKLS